MVMVQRLSDQDPASKDLSSLVDPIPDFSRSIYYDFGVAELLRTPVHIVFWNEPT